MGMVPPKSKVGDVVSVILGARTPLLLRQRSSSDSTIEGNSSVYKLVGECYIRGMMSGEMMKRNLVEEKLTFM